MSKPTLCVDFDGVLHAYTSGWQGVGAVADEPVPGAIEWLRSVLEHFDVAIYSSRSKDPKGVEAMRLWLSMWAISKYGPSDIHWLDEISFPTEKPGAFLTIDDRAICFDGDFFVLDPEKLLQFQPWNRGGESDRQRAQRAEAENARLKALMGWREKVQPESLVGPVNSWEVTLRINGVEALILGTGASGLSGDPNIGDYDDTVREAAEHLLGFAGSALATPPPESDQRLDECPTDVASMTHREYLESQGEPVDAHPTPEQTEAHPVLENLPGVMRLAVRNSRNGGEPITTERVEKWAQELEDAVSEQTGPRRDFVAGDDGYFTFSWTEQDGDALALFNEYAERGCWFWNTYKRQNAIAKIQEALTASGVPEYRSIETAPEGVRVLLKGGIDSPPVVGTVTHYEEEGPLCRVLHYNGARLVGAFHATHWRPLDSGVPYVPEEVRWLPEKWRSRVEQYEAYESEVAANQRGTFRQCANDLESALASAPADGWKEKYHELLYAVARKHPGESRHETALRYIQNAESGGDCQVAAAPTHGG